MRFGAFFFVAGTSLSVGAVAIATSVCAVACDGAADPLSSPTDASVDRHPASPTVGPRVLPDQESPAPSPPLPQPILDASCNVVTTAETVAPGSHVPEGSAITYNSNPPSSGPHYPVWANFQEFHQPVPDGYLVHSLEHGAVLLLYKCATPAECFTVASSLRKIRDDVVTDPGCDPTIRVRVILAPRPELDVPVAASAWGFTYKAACLDAPSLAVFIRDHYAHAPEDFCSPGATLF